MEVKELFISKKFIIREALKKLDDTGRRILLVVEYNKLQGVITDGDIRRWIIKNGDLDEKVTKIMNRSPKYILEKDIVNVKETLKKMRVEALPIVNKELEVIDIVFWKDNFESKYYHRLKISNKIIIMAGGKGARLEPYTKILPKPLIPIGDIPIIERIINNFTDFGCKDFILTVNYKKNMIKAYFNEIEKTYNVSFIEEEKPLGTAGSLYLLKDKLEDTFFISNCDVLIDGNYYDMIKYHKENNNKITLITSLKHFKIPYGVIELNSEGTISNIKEKPEFDFLVNTGMYILEPEVLKDIPKDTFFHITDLIDIYINKGLKIGIYPVGDKEWLDMGEFKEMENMIDKLGIR
ncbi:nucleotidyltransferase family protein [Sedimentibacter sp.]|uniref:nucleotidyltransferase family protein n=1 Tax=Sedimentibacter sp. TaxID=1960295 RepID=UPI00289ADE74|nr:nucleotidyltransferase family protein [Sedimentibacter sp.]